MQTKYTLAAAMVCWIVLIAAACHKKDKNGDDTGVTKTPREYLTNAKWRLVSRPSSYYDGTKYVYANYFDSMQSCEKDNVLTMLDDGKILFENYVKCDSTEPAIDSSESWILTADNKFIDVSDSLISDTFNVLKLNATTLIIAQSYEDEKDTSIYQNIK